VGVTSEIQPELRVTVGAVIQSIVAGIREIDVEPAGPGADSSSHAPGKHLAALCCQIESITRLVRSSMTIGRSWAIAQQMSSMASTHQQ
jgi:hypothetical protein